MAEGSGNPTIAPGRLEPEESEVVMEVKRRLVEMLGDRMIRLVLYGSRARGDSDRRSDIDIAIIVRGLTTDLKNRVLDAVADVEMEFLIPLSTFVVSEEQFEYLRQRERRIALDIEKEGIPL